jgi:predicted NBD/HSP70 family sugar kinase
MYDVGVIRIGIDVGGTKIEGLTLSADGRELARHRVATPTEYDGVLGAIAELVARLEAGQDGLAGKATVGIGTPGVLHPSRRVMLNANLACLNDRPLDRDLAAALGRPVRLANDGKCFVLSEAIDGAAAPPPDVDRGRPDVVFGATLGTGVGGGVVVDGRVLTGENGAATEWSHTTLPFLRPGEHAPYRCFCGHADCIESFTSGRALVARYRELGGGADADGTQISRLAAAGDATAEQAFAHYESALARALALVINMLDPRAIVLGGGVSNNARIFANVPKLWEHYTVPKDLRTLLVRAAHGDASGVRGAAFLW